MVVIPFEFRFKVRFKVNGYSRPRSVDRVKSFTLVFSSKKISVFLKTQSKKQGVKRALETILMRAIRHCISQFYFKSPPPFHSIFEKVKRLLLKGRGLLK